MDCESPRSALGSDANHLSYPSGKFAGTAVPSRTYGIQYVRCTYVYESYLSRARGASLLEADSPGLGSLAPSAKPFAITGARVPGM